MPAPERLALVLVFVSSAFVPVAHALSVHECVLRARTRAPEVRAALAEREAAEHDSLAGRFATRPELSVFGGATAAPRGFYDPTVTDLGGYELKAGLAWPLRDGGERARTRRRAAYGATSARLSERIAVRDAGLRAGELALVVLQLDEQAASQREALDWLDRLAVTLAAGARAGTRARADAQRATLERDDAASGLLGTERANATARRELARWLGAPPDSLPAVEPEALEPGPPGTADSLGVLAAFGAAPELLQARLEPERAQLEAEGARHRNDVQWTLALDAGLAGADLTAPVPEDLRATRPDATFADRLRRDLGASAALRFSRRLADPSRAHDEAARDAARRAALGRASSAAEDARRAALDLLDRWRESARRFERTQASAALAEENLLRVRSLHASGAASLLELLDARRERDDVVARLIQARFDLRLARLDAEER